MGHRVRGNWRAAGLLLALLGFAPIYLGVPSPADAAELKGYLKDVEVRWKWDPSSAWSPWEDSVFAQFQGSSLRQMQVWVEVYARASATFKIGVWSATDSEWLITTTKSVSAGTTYAWHSSGFTAPVIEQPLGVYLYYWDGNQYVQDDVAYGWVQVHSYLDLPGSPVVNDWGPNGVSRPTLT